MDSRSLVRFVWLGWLALAPNVASADARLLVWRGTPQMQLDAYVSALRDAFPTPPQSATIDSRDQLIAALNRALETSATADSPRDVVLLAPTVALDLADEERRALTLDVIPRALRAGSRLHVVSVGPGRDPLFARQLAQLTGGALTVQTDAASARDAMRAVLTETHAAGARVPAGGVFVVPPESAQITLLARMKAGAELSLTSPLEQVIDARSFAPGLEWFQQGDTALVTIDAPTPGRWRASGERATFAVYRDLRLALSRMDSPERRASAPINNSALVVQLEDAEGEVDEGVLWELSRLRAWLQSEGKAEPLAVESARASATPGKPHIALPSTLGAGERVVVSLESRTFNLIAKHPPDAPQFLKATLIPLDQGVVVARLELVDTSVVEASARIFASLVAQSGRTKLVLAAYARDRTWNAELPPLDLPVEVSFKVKAESITGSTVEMETEPIAWTPPLAASIVREFDASGTPVGLVEETRDETLTVTEAASGDSALAGSSSRDSTEAPTESASGDGHVEGADGSSLSTGEGARTLIIAAAVALGVIANGVLLFALIRRTRGRTSERSNGLSSAIDGYRQAMEARGA